jgi:RNA polymerase sigma factor (sigma-70 family)
MKSEAVLREFQRLLEPGTVAGLTERQLVERFALRGDAVAFEAIVTRHGPMVYSVCAQMLRDTSDADDAFQATFLVLIKKAAGLRQPERVGPWLYGVAHRIACGVRARRRMSNLPVELVGPRLACPVEANEQMELVHDEIGRLPEKYRVPIVLCCIEGLSHDEAATRLGWPAGTVHGRLSRARNLLRDRLNRRGVAVSEAIPGAFALLSAGRTILPETTRLAALALVRGSVPVSLEILAKGVISTMFIERLTYAGIIGFVAVIGLGAVTSALVAYQEPTGKPKAPSTDLVVPNSARNKAQESTAVPSAKSRAQLDRLKAEAELEASRERLDELVADAALIQIELDITKKSIEKSFEYLNNQQSRSPSFDSRLTEEQRQAAVEKIDIRRHEMSHQLNHDKKAYSENWASLARLRREIFKRARTLGVVLEPTPNATNWEQRFDQLEKKIDTIIDSLPVRIQP